LCFIALEPTWCKPAKTVSLADHPVPCKWLRVVFFTLIFTVAIRDDVNNPDIKNSKQFASVQNN
jgi:hypothetical protein